MERNCEAIWRGKNGRDGRGKDPTEGFTQYKKAKKNRKQSKMCSESREEETVRETVRGQMKEKISAVRGLAKHGDDNIDIDTVDTRRDGSTDSQTRERRCNRQIREGERDEASKARRDNTEG